MIPVMLFPGKRAQSAMKMTIFYIIFNLLIIIMITAFAYDSVDIGSSDDDLDIQLNDSAGSTDFHVSDADSWFSRFTVALFNLPWWASLLFTTYQLAGLSLIIYALIRGI